MYVPVDVTITVASSLIQMGHELELTKMDLQYPSATRYKARINYTRLHAETNALVH